MNLYSFTNDVLVLYIDKIILYHSHGNLDTTGLLVNIDYYYVCIVLYALYADTVRYVLYIDNKVLLLFILFFSLHKTNENTITMWIFPSEIYIHC